MAKVERFQCDFCQGLEKKIIGVEMSLTKKVLGASVGTPYSLKVEVCSMDCLLSSVIDRFASMFGREENGNDVKGGEKDDTKREDLPGGVDLESNN